MPILEAATNGNVTLVFSTHDSDHNNTLVLNEFLQGGMRAPNSHKTQGTPWIGPTANETRKKTQK